VIKFTRFPWVQLQQVLLNLIINAIEAMRDIGEKERELLISSRNESDGVSVEVRDSGPGFAPADIDRGRFGAWAVDLPVDYRSA
jgi:C4-dicarboxylate-specific signal transduction histidine kinase